MGTQFYSRLTKSDCRKLLKAINAAKRSEKALVTPKLKKVRKKRKKRIKTTEIVPEIAIEEQRMIQDRIVSEVVGVLEPHHFIEDLSEKPMFIDVLRWLLEIISDARFNGFRGIINKYSLADSNNPTAVLAKGLGDIGKTTTGKASDPFSVAVRNAAKAILAFVLTDTPITERDKSSPAQAFGTQLAKMNNRTLIRRFIKGFMTNCVQAVISKADPHRSQTSTQWAVNISEKALERAAKRAINKIERGGKLTDLEAIRNIVVAEFRDYLNDKRKVG